jgi:hypothetical protein
MSDEAAGMMIFLCSASQTNSNNKREDRRIRADRATAEQVREDTTLNGYIQQMSDLMLNTGLLSSERGDAVRTVARMESERVKSCAF